MTALRKKVHRDAKHSYPLHWHHPAGSAEIDTVSRGKLLDRQLPHTFCPSSVLICDTQYRDSFASSYSHLSRRFFCKSVSNFTPTWCPILTLQPWPTSRKRTKRLTSRLSTFKTLFLLPLLLPPDTTCPIPHPSAFARAPSYKVVDL